MLKVLVIKTSSMGDILHTLIALTDAARAIPNIYFDWVVEEKFFQIPTWHQAVRRVIPVAIRRWRKNWFGITEIRERCEFYRQLKKECYDVIIDAQGLIKSAFLVTRLAYGEKHGLDYKSAREPFSSWFYHRKHYVSKKQHAIERIRQLFAASLNYQIPNIPGEYDITNNICFNHIISKTNLFFLHATTKSSKQWPENHWRSLIQFASNAGYSIKLTWGEEHEHLSAFKLAQGFHTVQVLPYLTLSELAVQLLEAKAIVSVDTGLSHLAAALGRPNLTLYGPTDPKLIGAYGFRQQALRAKDGRMCSLAASYVWQNLQLMLRYLE